MTSDPNPHARSWFDLATAIVFSVALLAPWIDLMARPAEARAPTPEGRATAPMPALPASLSELVACPRRIEAHLEDVLGLRDVMLRWNSLEKLFVLGVSPTDRAYCGRSGWFFYAGSRSIDAWRGLVPWTPKELDAYVQGVVDRHDRLARRGIRHVLVIVPNKETIYPEFMPEKLGRVGPTRLDVLERALASAGFDARFDLRAALDRAKVTCRPDAPLYCSQGTHWESPGALVAYRGLIGFLARDFPEVRALGDDDLELVEAPRLYDSWARRMYVEDVLPRDPHELVPRVPHARVTRERVRPGMGTVRITEIPGSKLPRALLVHDSFGPYLERLLAENFSYLACAWSRGFDDELVERTRPDVVIELFVERALVRGSATDAGGKDE